MIAEVRKAKRRTDGKRRSVPSSAEVDASALKTKSPAELIDEAGDHPLGLDFLLQAPPETVAVTFQVHPFVVFRARVLLKNRGVRETEVVGEEE
jgi:hypothetical protein